MFHDFVDDKVETEKLPIEKGSSVGKSLKIIFRQDEFLKKIEEQPASISMLMNGIRLSLFLHLFENPCDHTRSIARNMDASLSVINWHLHQLNEIDYLESKTINGKRAYWPARMVLSEDVLMIQTIRNHWAPMVLRSIFENQEEVRQKSLVKELNVQQQTMNVWLRTMLSAGLLEKHGNRMESRYRINGQVIKKIAEYNDAAEGFSDYILDLLKNDGLMPKKPRMKGSRLSVYVKLPTGNKRVQIECNPMASLKRIRTFSKNKL